MKALFSESSWPNEGQRLLLKAALLDGAEALAAWEGWRGQVDFEKLDMGSLRLIPLLHHNLKRLGARDPNMDRFNGIRRKAWYTNQRIASRTADVLRALHARGIRSAVLKGMALGQLYYPDSSLRPMQDGDILVPEEKAADSVRILHDLGWRGVTAAPEAVPAGTDFTLWHAWSFKDADGVEIDLHWRVMNAGTPSGEEGEFWANARPIRVHGVDTLALCSTDQLLNACVHGIPWNNVPSLRWAADAHLIIASQGDRVDWGRLVAAARRRQYSVILWHALEFLRVHLRSPVPEEALSQLAKPAAPRWERAEYRTITEPFWVRARGFRLWIRFRRLRATDPKLRSLSWYAGYARYLQTYWRLDSPWQLPVAVVRRVGGALRHPVVDRRWKPEG